MEDDKVTTRVLDPTKYEEVVTTKDSETIDTSSSRIIFAWVRTAFTSERLNVITHVLMKDHCIKV